MASVRKRTWVSGGETKAAWVADYFDQAGKRHLKTFATKKAATSWLDTTRHEVKQGLHTPESTSATVAEAAAHWIRRGELEKLERSTLNKYRNHIDIHINPFLGTTKLARLTAPAVEQFKDDTMKRLSFEMTKKVLASLRAILAAAVRRGLVAQNAAATVRIRARRRDDRKLAGGQDYPSKSEITAILRAASGRWRPLLLTAVFTGLRSSELRGLTWDAVDFESETIHVRQRADEWGTIGSPKSEAGHRSIPMAPPVLNALREWKLACPQIDATGWSPGRLWLVFPNGAGKPESHANIVSRGVNPIQIAAGVVTAKGADDQQCAKYGMHALRHFFASWAIDRGFSPKRVQALLGHASIQMTFDVYGHLFPNVEDDKAKFAAGSVGLAG